jgi:GTP cyclohydrolase I
VGGLGPQARRALSPACDARRFSVQARIAQGIANELERIIEPHGVIVHWGQTNQFSIKGESISIK